MEENVRDMDAEYRDLKQKVDEIHEFCANLANALKQLENNPMIRTMIGL